MKKRILTALLTLCMLAAFVPCAMGAEEKQYDDRLRYMINTGGRDITITKCDIGASGEVAIPDKIDGLPVTTIHDNAFEGCADITGVTIPESITHVGNAAFSGCEGLTEIKIPQSVTFIGGMAFSECGSLNIKVDGSNENYSSTDGVLFNKDKTTIEAYAKDKIQPVYSIPDGVKNIAFYAFNGCSYLTEEKIPSGAEVIGGGAFFGCSSLADVTMPDGLTSIGDNAFNGCTALCEIHIPSSVTHISLRAFENTGFYNAPSNWEGGVLYADNCLLCAKPDITECNIKTGCRLIAVSAFTDCGDLTSVTVPESVKSINSSAFTRCTALTDVTLQEGLTSIGGGAFDGCVSLKTIDIPSTVTDIESCFSGCGSLNINVDDANQYYCDINGVLFNKDKTKILAFAKDKLQPSYNIPDGVTDIGSCAFSGCSALTGIGIPASVTQSGAAILTGCADFNVYYSGTREEWQNLNIGLNTELLFAPTFYGGFAPIAPATLTVTPSGDGYVLTAETDYDGEAYAAAYDAEGALLNVVSEPFADGTATVMPDTAGAAKIKFFVWTNVVQPVTLTKEITLN